MKRFIFSLIFFLLLTSILMLEENSLKNTIVGKIKINKDVFTYIQSLKKVDVISSNNKIVFHSESKSDYEAILNTGYSTNLGSFYAFKLQLDINTKKNNLILETKTAEYIIKTNSETSFYTPILIDYSSTYILFLTEDFSIVVLDFQTGELIKKVSSDVPIFKLEKLKTEKGVEIKFLAFSQGIYKAKYIDFESFLYDYTTDISKLKYKKSKREPLIRDTPLPTYPHSLSYNDFLCFGDSITYGYINKQPAQSLGYVPRLDIMINENLYSANTINEGYPGTQTYEAVEFFDPILKKHNAKYLLFHYGTNDAIHTEVPISSVLFNIRYMIKSSLDYGMYPIISTLIPRNGWTGVGILRSRAIQINDGIKDIAESLQIPVIDFWNLFSLFPEEEGGYMSLMSDNVHPSEEGYHLMAVHWFEYIKKIAPAIPTNIHILNKTQTLIKIAWDENIAETFSHWVIEFSFFNKDFSNSLSTEINSQEFKINPFSNNSLYLKIKTVNNNDVSSEFSEVFEVKLRD